MDALHERIRQMRGDGKHRKTRTGIVKGIHEHYDRKDIARIELEDTAPPAKTRAATARTEGPVAIDYRRRFDVEVPKAHARGLQLGDRVHVHTTIEKA